MYLMLSGISKQFEGKTVVQPLELTIDKGEFVTLLGPSGCGKTTILKLIGGFIAPTQGRIFLDGIDMTVMSPEDRPVTTVFQNYALFPHMTVLENVMYGLRYQVGYQKKMAREQALAMLELVNLHAVPERNVSKLSGGQQQRVALARALVMRPKVLLLDEPLSNLDAKLRVRIRKDIKHIQEKLGITMLFVTHDQEEALSLSDRVVVMQAGKVEQIGTPKEIYLQPKTAFVASFVGRANIMGSGAQCEVIRPESLSPAIESVDYCGRIVQKQYMGSYTTYFVEVNGMILEMDVCNLNDRNWLVGDPIGMKKTICK